MGGTLKMFRTGLLLFLLIFVVGCHQEPKKISPEVKPQAPQEQQKEQKNPNTEFKNLHYVIYEKGKLKWDIYAQEALVYKGNKVQLTKLKVCAAPKQGVCITSEKGLYDPKKGSFTFEGHVVLQTPHEGRLETARLSYIPKKEVLKTMARIKINKQGLIIKGQGFIYDLRSGVMKVLHQTEVHVDG